MKQPDVISIILEKLAEGADRSTATAQAHLTIQLATISLLVDAKIVTIEEACQRIEQIHERLADGQGRDQRERIIRIATDWLRAHDKPANPPWTPVVLQGGRRDDPES